MILKPSIFSGWHPWVQAAQGSSHQSSRGRSNGAMAQGAPLNPVPQKQVQGKADGLPWKQTQLSNKHFST